MLNFDRKILIARIIVADVFDFDIFDYAFMTDNELLANYLIMLDTLEHNGYNIPTDWEVKF